MPQFTPPSTYFVPRVLASTRPEDRKPMEYMKADIPRGDNIWWWTDETISSQQPPLWEKRLNADGTYTPGVKKVWYGGHSPYDITDYEKMVLTAAGYGSSITG